MTEVILMKKAIQIGYNESFEKKCKFAAEAGFDGIAVNFTEVLDKTEYEWADITENIQRILDENTLECVQTHPYYYDLRVSSEEIEDRLEFAVKQAIIAGGKLGAKWNVIHPRSSVSTGFRVKEAMEDNKKVFADYLECAEKHNTGVAAENLPVFSGIIPCMPFFSSNYEDLCNLVDSFNVENIGICWDTGHANMMSFDQADAIKFLGNRIKCTHIHNNFKRQDLHLPPDCGDIDWEKVMGAFYSIGYDGPLTLETHCLYPEDDMLRAFAVFNLAGLNMIEKLYK